MELGANPRNEERRGSVSLLYAVADPGADVVWPLGPLGIFPSEDPAYEAPEPAQEGAASRPDFALHLGGVRGGGSTWLFKNQLL